MFSKGMILGLEEAILTFEQIASYLVGSLLTGLVNQQRGWFGHDVGAVSISDSLSMLDPMVAGHNIKWMICVWNVRVCVYLHRKTFYVT